LFPPKILNLRLKTSIEQFFSDLEQFFKMKNWEIFKPEEIGDFHWKTPDLEIKAIARFPDDSIRTIQYALKIPGVIDLKGNEPIYSYNHTFRIELPREYPARVDKIKILADTQLFHPRFSISGVGEACIQINGEIDRILMDMIFQVLLDPDRVRPPKFYSDADFGRNSFAMKWYQNEDPRKIYETLLHEWEILRVKNTKPRARVVDNLPSGKKGPKILD
jgi:hypothetical protein